MKQSGIYKLTFPNGKVYIGLSKNILKRWSQHKREADHCFNASKLKNVTKLRGAYRKYTWSSITKEIIELCSIDQLNDREIYFISKYDSFHNGLNCTSGGNINYERDPKDRQKYVTRLGKVGGVQAIAFFIDNVRYVSILDASKQLGIAHKTIHNRLRSKNIKYQNYKYEEICLIPERYERNNGREIKVEVFGVKYDSVSEASRATGIPSSSILRRCHYTKAKYEQYKII